MSSLVDRTRCISVTDKTSPDVCLYFNVPHGSEKYCVYKIPVGGIIKRHNSIYHCYVDGTEVYMTLKSCDKWDDTSSSIESCIEHIGIWKSNIMLKLNKDQIEFYVFSYKTLEELY